MRRILCVILLGGLLLTMLSGCTSREPSPESGSESLTASASEPLSPEDPSELVPAHGTAHRFPGRQSGNLDCRR